MIEKMYFEDIPLEEQQSKIKLIFLDIDGVMNHTSNVIKKDESDRVYFEERSMDWVSKRCIEILNDIVFNTEAKVVITSTWRKDYTLKQLKEFFERAGFVGKIVGMTDAFDEDSCRGDEIRDFLIRKFGRGQEARSKFEYVILDDDSDMLYSQRENFVNVDYTVGLTPKIAYKVTNILNGVRFV